MVTAASGIISVHEDVAEMMLADSVSFRTWVGATTQAQAMSRIHPYAVDRADGQPMTLSELQSLRPICLMSTEQDPGSGRLEASGVSGNGRFEFTQFGRINFEFQKDIPTAITKNVAEIFRRFNNDMGDILNDLAQFAGRAGYLAANAIEWEGPYRSPKNERAGKGDYMQFFVSLDWSSGGGS